MQELDDNALLKRYTDQNSEEAFAALVARHINKVYSVALRHTRNPHQAEEITQAVFVTLAKKARHLRKDVVLSGWLYLTARLSAVTFIRSEIRRARREQEVFMQNVTNETESDVWPQIAPLLDTAMTELNEDDRLAIVLRFFDGRSMGEIGTTIGVSEDAAKKRVTRAVEKLRFFFTKRGVVLPAAILTGAISANSVQAAPVGLAKTISMVAMAQGTTVGGSIMALFKAGFWKALLPAAPFVGSVFFFLKAEVENGKSPRERQFIARMIWLRFTAALLGMAVPIVIGFLMPSIFKQPGVIEYGFAGFCFLGAVEVGARTVYFHRRRRQIQIEDGTWEEFDSGKLPKPDEFVGDLMGKTSKANQYAAIAMVFGFVGALIFMPIFINRMLAAGHWIVALLVLVWVVVRWIRHWRTGNWRQLPRLIFDARFGKLAKIIILFAVMSLALFDLSWARGRLLPSWEWAIAFNILVALAYAVLIQILAKVYRPIAVRQDSTSN
jgi:RNA polymerase sigma factor (sigma-70 family)